MRRPRHKIKEIDQILKALAARGYEITCRKHYKIRAPNGVSIGISGSPSGLYALQAIKRDLKKYLNVDADQLLSGEAR